MRLHFAAEIILELVYQNFNRPEKIGANITEDKARVDFKWEGNISKIFPLLENRAREIIESNFDIVSRFSDEENEILYMQFNLVVDQSDESFEQFYNRMFKYYDAHADGIDNTVDDNSLFPFL
jgi:Ser-tRNA(Ala) deacylase AlaX